MHNSNSMYFDQLDIVRLVRCSSTCSMYFDQFGAVRRVRCNSMRIDVYICNVQTRSTHNDISVQICHCGSSRLYVTYIYIDPLRIAPELVELHRTGSKYIEHVELHRTIELYRLSKYHRIGIMHRTSRIISYQSNCIEPVDTTSNDATSN